MTKHLLLTFFFSAIALPALAMPAMPFEGYLNPSNRFVAVADRCGFNKYRDARGVCRRKYIFELHQRKRPVYSVCGGLNAHRVCNLFGQCWVECD